METQLDYYSQTKSNRMKKLIKEIFERNNNTHSGFFPNKFFADEFIDKLFNLLFVNGAVKYKTIEEITVEYQELEAQFFQLLLSSETNEENAEHICSEFFKNIPALYSKAIRDAKAILAFDPAAHSLDEVLHVYPGFYAIAVHRISHYLWQSDLPSLSRLFAEKAHSKTGIDIHPGALIGDDFAIDHGTGIVIGETAVIGSRVKIYQGVTLGAVNVAKEKASEKRHPTIEDDVIIYGNATILGGSTTIGRESVIGGNVWLTSSVPAFSVVFHKSEIKIKSNFPFEEPINFII
jgi:serine O-acetyltransferase